MTNKQADGPKLQRKKLNILLLCRSTVKQAYRVSSFSFGDVDGTEEELLKQTVDECGSSEVNVK